MASLSYTTVSAKELLLKFESDEMKGLSDREAAARLREYGSNEVSAHTVPWWRIFLSQFHSPFTYLLVGAAVLTGILGEN